jgi:hypothetical protein
MLLAGRGLLHITGLGQSDHDEDQFVAAFNSREEQLLLGVWTGRDANLRPITAPMILSPKKIEDVTLLRDKALTAQYFLRNAN